jgi:hypothetical protein
MSDQYEAMQAAVEFQKEIAKSVINERFMQHGQNVLGSERW